MHIEFCRYYDTVYKESVLEILGIMINFTQQTLMNKDSTASQIY